MSELIGYLDHLAGVPNSGGKLRPLFEQVFLDRPTKQQTGPSKILGLEMVERVNRSVDPSYGHRVGCSTKRRCNRPLVGLLYFNQRCNRPQQAVQSIASGEQRR